MEIREENRENCAQRTCMQRRRKRNIVTQGKTQNFIMQVYIGYMYIKLYTLPIIYLVICVSTFQYLKRRFSIIKICLTNDDH